MPRAAHRLIDQSVGGIVADEKLGVGIEVQGAVQPQGAGAQIHERRAAVTDLLVEREFAPCAHALQKTSGMVQRKPL